MKTLAIVFAALASACASTAPQQRLAANGESCSALARLHAANGQAANLIGSRAVGATGKSACAMQTAQQGMTPAALHTRAQASSPTRRGGTLH